MSMLRQIIWCLRLIFWKRGDIVVAMAVAIALSNPDIQEHVANRKIKSMKGSIPSFTLISFRQRDRLQLHVRVRSMA